MSMTLAALAHLLAGIDSLFENWSRESVVLSLAHSRDTVSRSCGFEPCPQSRSASLHGLPRLTSASFVEGAMD